MYLLLKLKKLRKKVIQQVFSRYYSHFEYPFFHADSIRSRLPEPNQFRYYEDVSNWINSEAYKIEHEALVRDFYKELAIKPLTDDQIAGYRLALIFVKNYEARLGSLAQEYTLLKATAKTANRLR